MSVSQESRLSALEAYLGNHVVDEFSVSPDGQNVFFTSTRDGQMNLWRVPAEGGAAEQLTAYRQESVRNVACSPDGRWTAYTVDHEGDERQKIRLIRGNGGSRSNANGFSYGANPFSPDGQYLAFAMDATTGEGRDIWAFHMQVRTSHPILANGSNLSVGAWSPDSRHLVAVQFNGNLAEEVLLADLADGHVTNLTDMHAEATYVPIAWLPDGKGFLCLTDFGRDHKGIAYCDVGGKVWRYEVTAAWEIEEAAMSPDGKLLAWVLNDEGYSRLHMTDLERKCEVPVPPVPEGVIRNLQFAPGESGWRLFFLLSTYCTTDDVYSIDMDRQEFKQITRSMVGRARSEEASKPVAVHLESSDGKLIQAWLHQPRVVRPGQRCPVLISIHGGPELQERPNYVYNGFYRYLLSKGIAVLAPNIRGSAGFGRQFQQLIYRDWGGAELNDIAASVRYLRACTWVDPERIGIWGVSFGGFAALAAASRVPGPWACCCSMSGPTNLVTLAEGMPKSWLPFARKWLGDSEKDRTLLEHRSPLSWVDHFQCPVLVLHGTNDPRVAGSQSSEFVKRMKSHGKDIDYLAMDGEGHGLVKRSDLLMGFEVIASFVERHLLSDGT